MRTNAVAHPWRTSLALKTRPLRKTEKGWAMTLKIHLSEPAHRCGCDRCGLTDPEGGVLLEDDTEARRVFCRACTLDFLASCLTRTRSIAPAS
jgi:hypothetical protein